MQHRLAPNNTPPRRDQRRLVGNPWRRLSGWIRTNTFAPSWLPAYLRRPLIGYLVAILLAGVAAGLTLLLELGVEEFSLHDLLLLLAVVLVALTWGVGPSLVATVFGAALLSYLLFPPRFTASIESLDEAVSLGLILVVGILVSLLTGQVARARRQADQARQEAEAQAAQLRTALGALEEAKERLHTFLGVTGHELRTPITTLKLSLQMTQRRLQHAKASSDPASLVEPLHASFLVTEREVQRLERLVHDLLEIARVQAGKLELRREVVDLVPIVREAVEGQRQAAPDRCITLQVQPEVPLPVSVDAGRMEQVVTNYLTNALKYAPAARPIEVGVQEEPQQVRVWVRDEGPGLPLEEQERVWERFHRVKGIEVQQGSGTGLGLGLHICRMIIEQHGGQVGVESTPGVGSTFWFTLPLPSPADEDLSSQMPG